jgi:hypothetical protein
MQRRRNFRITWTAVALGLAVIVLVEGTALGLPVKRTIKVWIDYVWWDLILQSHIKLKNVQFTVPKGRYGWIVHDDFSVTIASRLFPRDEVVLVEVGPKARPLDPDLLVALCKSKSCRDLKHESLPIDGKTAQVIWISYEGENRSMRKDAMVYSSIPPVGAKIYSSEARFDETYSLVTQILGQLSRPSAKMQ